MKKISLPLIIVILVIAWGAYSMLQQGTLISFILPIVAVAVILLLLKYLPLRGNASRKSNRAAMSDAQRYKEAVRKQKQKMKQKPSQSPSTYQNKTLPFKVIEGGRDDNDTPRYH